MTWLLLVLAATFAALWWRERSRRAPTTADPTRVEHERLQAAVAERRRILQDIHDDIGVKLLSLLHELREGPQADQLRSVMQDLRDVVSRSGRAAGTLREVLARIREEAEPRLESMGAVLDWQLAPDLPDPPLDEAQALHLHRISREAISNAIRHGGARHLRVRCQRQGDTLVLDYTDDGPGRPAEVTEGTGSGSLRERAQALGGDIRWLEGTSGGAKLVLQFPLPPEPG